LLYSTMFSLTPFLFSHGCWATNEGQYIMYRLAWAGCSHTGRHSLFVEKFLAGRNLVLQVNWAIICWLLWHRFPPLGTLFVSFCGKSDRQLRQNTSYDTLLNCYCEVFVWRKFTLSN
jgi:hypothetical protein